MSEHVAGRILKKPLKIELDQAQNKVLFNELDIDTYEKKLSC